MPRNLIMNLSHFPQILPCFASQNSTFSSNNITLIFLNYLLNDYLYIYMVLLFSNNPNKKYLKLFYAWIIFCSNKGTWQIFTLFKTFIVPRFFMIIKFICFSQKFYMRKTSFIFFCYFLLNKICKIVNVWEPLNNKV